MSVSSQVIEILDDLCKRFGLAIDWTSENVMPYLQELVGKFIAWEIATSIMWLVFGGTLIAIGIWIAAYDLTTEHWMGVGLPLSLLFLIPGIIIVLVQVYDILTCIYFPELQVIQYIKESGVMK